MSEANGLPELPMGWKWAKIADIAFVTKLAGFEFTKFIKYQDSGSVRVIRGLNIGYGEFKAANFKYIDNSVSDALPRSQLQGGELLIAYVGTLGTAAILPKDGQRYHLGPNVGKVVIDKSIEDARFLLYFLLSPTGQNLIHSTSKAVAQSSLSMQQIRAFAIPVAPLLEQHLIVAKIEELFTKLDAGVDSLKKARAQLGHYRQTVLKAAVTGELTREWREAHRGELEPAADLLARILRERRAKWEADQLARMQAAGRPPKNDDWRKRYAEPISADTNGLTQLPYGWVWVSPNQIAAVDDYALAIGPFGSNLKVSDYRKEGVPLIFVRNIRSSTFGGLNTQFVSPKKAAELRAHQVTPGDILITKMGDPPGDACLYPEGQPQAVITADCIKWTLSLSLNTRQYFVIAVNSDLIRSQILGITKGVAQQKVSLGRFKTLAVPLPPLEEQQVIIEEVERLLSIADAMERTIEQSLKQAARLRQSILQQAFAGKLVPQDPNDEPASRLLERIREERAREAEAVAPKQKRKSSKRKQAAQTAFFT